MANGAPSPNGPKLEPATPMPQQVPRSRTTIQHQFAVGVEPLEGGGRQLDIVFPDQSVLSLPMDADMAKTVGERLTAPSVHVPPNGANGLH